MGNTLVTLGTDCVQKVCECKITVSRAWGHENHNVGTGAVGSECPVDGMVYCSDCGPGMTFETVPGPYPDEPDQRRCKCSYFNHEYDSNSGTCLGPSPIDSIS